MSDKKRETVDIQELVISNTITNSALAQILIKKGIATQEEILSEISNVQKEMHNKSNKNKDK